MLDHFNEKWQVALPGDAIPEPEQEIVQGCSGSSALKVSYDLRNAQPAGSQNAGQSWVVIWKTLPVTDLRPYTHIRLSMKGSSLDSHEYVEVKLKDSADQTFTARLKSMTDLPAWRPIYIDFREFVRDTGVLDLQHIVQLEIGIVRCVDAADEDCEVPDVPVPQEQEPPAQHMATLWLDELAVVNLRPGGAHRLTQSSFAEVPVNPAVRAGAANALLAQIETSGPGQSLTPAWYPQTEPNFNTYAQAEALLVFVYEYERSGTIAYRDAANALAARLIELQIPPGKQQAGGWFTGYAIDSGVLVPPTRSIAPGGRCNGDEVMVGGSDNDLNTCAWVGNSGWVLIALGRLQRSGFYPNPAALSTAIARGADWIAGQSAYRNLGYPDLITLGIEGNLSAYFGLLAAGRRNEAATLGDAIFEFGFDPVQRRMKPGVLPRDAATAIDVSGSWGATFLRASGRTQEALDSMGYSASVMRTVSFNGAIRGYGDIAGPYTPAVEFTGQAAGAGISDAAAAMEQMLLLQDPAYPGAFRGAADHWYGGALTPWATTMAGVSPTAWVHFAFHLDPLLPYVAYADDPIVPASTLVRLDHARELRSRIDRLRGRFALPAFDWTDLNLTRSATVIKAKHVQDLRTAICDVYALVHGRPAPAICTAPPMAAGQTVMGAHVSDIRAAVFAIE